MKLNKHGDIIEPDNTMRHKANKRVRARAKRKSRKTLLQARRSRGQTRTGHP